MKRNLGLLALAMVFFVGCLVYVPRTDYGSPPPAPSPGQQDEQWNYDNPDASDYYSYLEPSGMWVTYPSYGYVWIPRGIGYGWRPYCLGRWVWTDLGWTWVSAENWGWLVYHYGRWGWDAQLGWFWVPGTVWGPAWVAWRWGGAYMGWAPLPPGAEFVVGVGFRRLDFEIPSHYWNFVHGPEFMEARLDRWVIPPERNVSIINYTRVDVNIHVRNNLVVNEGVSVDYVQRQTNRVVERYTLTDVRRPGQAQLGTNDVSVYRPAIRPNQAARPKVALAPGQAAERRATVWPTSAGYARGTAPDQETAIRQRHEQEMQRLNDDQQAEVRAIQQKAASDRQALRTPAERQRADAASQARIAEVQKNHEAERTKMAQRHRAEEEQARRSQPKKNEPGKH